MDKGPPSFGPLRNRTFLAYWLTGLTANFGWLIQMVGASWLMTSIGGTPQQIALVQTSLALPILIFAIPAGALADTFGRRTVIIWSQSILLAVSTALAVVTGLGEIGPWSLLAFTFLIGCCKALNNPGWQTLVSEFMPRAQLQQAVALNSVSFNIARSLGPAIGGVIVATVGAFAAFVVNALSNVGMIVVMARWKQGAAARTLPPESIGTAIASGVRFVALSPAILRVISRSILFNFGAVSLMALMPLIARDLLQSGPGTYGILLGAFGLGAVAGAILGGRLWGRMTPETRARVGFLAFADGTAVVALSRSTPLTLLASALAGMSWLLTQSAFNAAVQMSSPRWVVARAHACYQASAFGANALGAGVWGAVTGEAGLTVALIAAAATLCVSLAAGLLAPLTEIDAESVERHDRPWRKPDVALDLLPRSGPILTEIEFLIDPADVPQFIELMAERRRSRTRDGARRWSLSRDLENPRAWTERFRTPTWTETLRHHERRTVGDLHLGARLRALHRGDGRPRIRHHLDRQVGWRPHPAPEVPPHEHH